MDFKVVPGGSHGYFFQVKVETDDGIYPDHGYLDTIEIPDHLNLSKNDNSFIYSSPNT